jgi:CMP-N-acetylneuraminic acid synthetase
VVRWVEAQGDYCDAICLLQPTTPLRTSDDIDACVELLEQNDVDAVVAILPVPLDYNPHWVYFRDCDGFLRLSTGEEEPIPRRQGLPEAFHRSGSVYVTRRDTLMEHNSLYGQRLIGYLLNPDKHVSIDTPADWQRAEDLLRAASS